MDKADASHVPDYGDDHSRNEVADDLADVMDEAMRKFTTGRVRDAQNEKVRISWLRAFVSAVAEYRKLVGDIEDAEMAERLDRFEQQLDDLADDTGDGQ